MTGCGALSADAPAMQSVAKWAARVEALGARRVGPAISRQAAGRNAELRGGGSTSLSRRSLGCTTGPFQERKVTGKVRPISSLRTAAKVNLGPYLARYGGPDAASVKLRRRRSPAPPGASEGS